MKKKSVLLTIGILIAVGVVGAAVLMGQPQTQKGSLTGSTAPTVSNAHFTYFVANDEYPSYTVNFASAVTPVKFDLLNNKNNVVKTVCADNENKNAFTCQWDGTNASNQDFADSGMYKFRISYGSSYANYLDSEAFEVISEEPTDEE